MNFLTPKELEELTGYVVHTKQEEALNRMGIEYRKRPNKTLVVSHKHLEQILGAVPGSGKAETFDPNWNAI